MSFEVNPLKNGLMNSAQDTYAGNCCHGCFFLWNIFILDFNSIFVSGGTLKILGQDVNKGRLVEQ